MFKGTDEAIICRKSFANYGWEGGGGGSILDV